MGAVNEHSDWPAAWEVAWRDNGTLRVRPRGAARPAAQGSCGLVLLVGGVVCFGLLAVLLDLLFPALRLGDSLGTVGFLWAAGLFLAVQVHRMVWALGYSLEWHVQAGRLLRRRAFLGIPRWEQYSGAELLLETKHRPGKEHPTWILSLRSAGGAVVLAETEGSSLSPAELEAAAGALARHTGWPLAMRPLDESTLPDGWTIEPSGSGLRALHGDSATGGAEWHASSNLLERREGGEPGARQYRDAGLEILVDVDSESEIWSWVLRIVMPGPYGPETQYLYRGYTPGPVRALGRSLAAATGWTLTERQR